MCSPYRVASFAFPAVWVESLLFVCEGLGLYGESTPLLTSHFLPALAKQDADCSTTHNTTLLHCAASQQTHVPERTVPVVFAWEHLRVLHPELLGEQHEGVHRPLAPDGRVVAPSLCTGGRALVWLLMRGAGVCATVGICEKFRKSL